MALALAQVARGFTNNSATSLTSSGFTANSGDLILVDVSYREATATGVPGTLSLSSSHGGAIIYSRTEVGNAAGSASTLARFYGRCTSSPGSGTLLATANKSGSRWRLSALRVTGGAALPTNHGTKNELTSTVSVGLASAETDPDSLLVATIVSPGKTGGITPGSGWSEVDDIGSADDGAPQAMEIQQIGPPPTVAYADWSAVMSGTAGNLMIISEIHELLATVNTVIADDGLFFTDDDARLQEKVFTDPVVF